MQLLNPITPHITEELWHSLGNKTPLVDTKWPEADKSMLIDESVIIAVQLNGKMRGTVEMPANSSQQDIENAAKELSNVKQLMDGKAVKKVIYVPSKIINIICA